MAVGYGATNFGGGLLQGIAQGMRDRQERARQERLDAMNEKLFKLKEQEGKLKMGQMKLTQSLLNMFSDAQKTGQQQAQAAEAAGGTQQAPQYPEMPTMQGPPTEAGMSPRIMERAQPQEGIPGTLASQQLKTMMGDPMSAAMLESATGGAIPFMDISKETATQRQRDIANYYKALEEERDRFRLQRENLAGTWGERTLPDGTVVPVYRYKYPSLAGRSTMSGPAGEQEIIKPSKVNMPIPSSELQNWRGPTGEPLNFGVTPKQAEAMGAKKLTTDQLKQVNMSNQLNDILAHMETLMVDVFGPAAKDPNQWEMLKERFGGGARRWLGAYMQTNPSAAKLKRYIDGIIPKILRSMGEVGALSEIEQQRGKALLPDVFDNPQVAWGLLEDLRAMQQNAIDRIYGRKPQNSFQQPSQTVRRKVWTTEELDAIASGEK